MIDVFVTQRFIDGNVFAYITVSARNGRKCIDLIYIRLQVKMEFLVSMIPGVQIYHCTDLKLVNRDYVDYGETVIMYPACVLTFVSSHISKMNSTPVLFLYLLNVFF